MSSPLASLRVLAIDDHAVILKTLKVVLGGLGITDIDEALSVDAAEVLIREAPAYDVIFCDLNLPGRDGIEFLRGMPQLAGRTAVVLLSGEDERILQSVAAMGRASGLSLLAAISKPPTARKIADALAHLDEVVPSRRPAEVNVSLSAEQFDEMLSGGMLSLHFQPKVRVSDGELVGVEALLRGKHPIAGPVPPQVIVNAASGDSRVGELTRFVLDQAIAAAGRFHKDGLKLSMAINLDHAALKYVRLPDHVGEMARKYEVPMASIILEVTEEQLFYGYVQALDVTTRLRLKRCQLSVDDYGSGVSGLRQLNDLPLSELKIDRPFIAGCDTSTPNRAIIKAAVGIARAFGMTTVAEGVETEAEWNTVKELGVDLVQGFLVAKPMAEGMLEDWTTEWTMRPR